MLCFTSPDLTGDPTGNLWYPELIPSDEILRSNPNAIPSLMPFQAFNPSFHSQLQVLGWCSIMYKYVCTNYAWDSFGIRINPPISKYARRQHVHVKSCAAAAVFQPTPALGDWFPKEGHVRFSSILFVTDQQAFPEILRHLPTFILCTVDQQAAPEILWLSLWSCLKCMMFIFGAQSELS